MLPNTIKTHGFEKETSLKVLIYKYSAHERLQSKDSNLINNLNNLKSFQAHILHTLQMQKHFKKKNRFLGPWK